MIIMIHLENFVKSCKINLSTHYHQRKPKVTTIIKSAELFGNL